MTSLAVTTKALDAALAARYSGIVIDVDSVSTPVAVFIEEPATEEFTERTYPSIAIKQIAINADFTVHHSTDDVEEETAYDTGVTPYVRTMRKRPIPARVLYSIDTWHRVRASESRDLVEAAVLYRTEPRGYLTVANVDGVDIDLWAFWSGGVATNDELDADVVIYHKSLTLEVLAHLAQVPVDSTTDHKVVMESRWKFFKRKAAHGAEGIEIVPGGDTEDITFRVTDTVEEKV